MTTQAVYRYDPDIGYMFIPGLGSRIDHEAGGYLLHTNAQGFRCVHDFEETAPAPGTRRVLLFGDSFTAGVGVSNKHRFGDLLESNVRGLEVYNFGLPGSGTDQQYLIYRKFAQAIPRDLVVAAVLVENIRRVASRFRVQSDAAGRAVLQPKPYFELAGGALRLGHSPVPAPAPNLGGAPTPVIADERGEAARKVAVRTTQKVDRGGRFEPLRRMVRATGMRDLVQRLTRYQPVDDYNSPDCPNWRLLRAILLEWRRACDVPMVLMPLPLYQHIEGTADAAPYQARFRELAQDGGFILHDPLPDLLRYSAAERRAFRFATDVHLTREGHKAVARSLAPRIAGLLNGAG